MKGGINIKVLTRSIISNSQLIKNYRSCREKAESLGKIFILKNNLPDAVLFSIKEYEKFSPVIEHMENLDEKDLAKFIKAIQEYEIGKY